MSSPMKIALIGIGGYGSNFVAGMLDPKPGMNVTLVAVVDPFPAACARLGELHALGVPVFPTVEQMYAHHSPELVVIASPIHVHCEQTVMALRHGSHVMCEKPLCATLDQIDQMIEARDLAKRQVAIGYQWCFDPKIHALKRDIAKGHFGKPIRLSSFVGWPRDERYYNRNPWAGRQFEASGKPVFDSPVNNACAHYLQTMLYVLGDRIDSSATPRDVTAELFRANPIENYDTAAIRCLVGVDAEIFFFVTHATGSVRGPLFRFEFEKATVAFDSITGEGIIARFNDGRVLSYGHPAVGIGKLWIMIDSIRKNEPVSCGIEAAAAQTQVMAAAQQNEIMSFPPSLVRVQEHEGERLRVVEGLAEGLLQCYEQHKMPSEIGFNWAKQCVPTNSLM